MLSRLLYNVIAFLLTYTTSYSRIQYSSFKKYFAKKLSWIFFSASKFSLLKFISLQKSTLLKITYFASSSVPRRQTLLSWGVTPGNSVPADEKKQTGGCAVDFQLLDLCLLETAGSAENEYILYICYLFCSVYSSCARGFQSL